MKKKFINEKDLVILGKVFAPIIVWVAAIFSFFSGTPSNAVSFTFYVVFSLGLAALFAPYKKLGKNNYSKLYLLFLVSFFGLYYVIQKT